MPICGRGGRTFEGHQSGLPPYCTLYSLKVIISTTSVRITSIVYPVFSKEFTMDSFGRPIDGKGYLLDMLRIMTRHSCQMAIAGFLDRMCLALRASGLWLRYATLQNLIPSFPWIAPPHPPPWRNPRKGRDQILPSGNLALRSSFLARLKMVMRGFVSTSSFSIAVRRALHPDLGWSWSMRRQL